MQAAKATISAAEEALVNARESAALAEERYEHGLGSAIELGDAQVGLHHGGGAGRCRRTSTWRRRARSCWPRWETR